DAHRLTFTIGAIAPGTKLDLKVVRDGDEKKLKVTTAERPSRRRASFENPVELSHVDEGVLNGVGVEDIDPNTRNRLNHPWRLKGAVITPVDPDSASARAGLRPGDVILEINREPVRSAQDAIDLSPKAESKKTLVRLWSRGSTIFVVVDERGT